MWAAELHGFCTGMLTGLSRGSLVKSPLAATPSPSNLRSVSSMLTHGCNTLEGRHKEIERRALTYSTTGSH